MASKAEYLKRYLSGAGDDAAGARGDAGEKKKRRRKKDRDAPSGAHHPGARVRRVGAGVRVVDNDVDDWKRAREDADAARRRDEEAPVVVTEDGRETTEADGPAAAPRRRYLGIGEDGSGWAVADDDDARDEPRDDDPGGGDGDVSPPRPRRARHDTDSDDDEGANTAGAEDLSPPRRRARHDSSDDEDAAADRSRSRSPSPAGRSKRPAAASAPDDAADLSPPRRDRTHAAHDSPPDQSPPRRRVEGKETASFAGGDDLSPPRRRGRGGETGDSPRLRSPEETTARGLSGDADLSPPRRGAPTMTDGTRTGLVAASDVVREAAERREAAMRRVAAMSDEASGRGAATRVRDKATGAALSDAEARRRRDALEREKDGGPTREKPAWSRGIAQARSEMQSAADLREEADAPFARAEVDAKTDAAMKAATRFGDPMAARAKKRGDASGDAELSLPSVVAGLSEEVLRRGGFRIPQGVPAHSWLKRGMGAGPPNRFGIKPGRHWDGVDRSTGFEQELFKAQNDRRTREQSNWKYAQSMWE